MRLLNVKTSAEDFYVVIDKIENFRINKVDKDIFLIEAVTVTESVPLAYTKKEPEKVIENLLNIIDSTENQIIKMRLNEESFNNWRENNE